MSDYDHSTNESTNESDYQTDNRSPQQSNNHSNDQSNNESFDERSELSSPNYRANERPIKQSGGRSSNQSNNRSSNQSNNRSANELSDHEDDEEEEDEIYRSGDDEDHQSNNQTNDSIDEATVAVMSSLGVRAPRARRSLQTTPSSSRSSRSTKSKQSNQSNPVPCGKGQLLCDIPNVAHRLEKAKAANPEFKKLLSLLFPHQYQKLNKNKLKMIAKTCFNGLSDDVVNYVEKKLRRTLSDEEPLLSARLFALMDLDYERDENDDSIYENNVARAMSFLKNPQPTGQPPVKLKMRATSVRKDSKKRSLSNNGDVPLTKKQRVADAAKRSPNSFIIFMSAQRDELRAQHPEMTVQAITARLGEMWRNLPLDEKEVYDLAAQKLKEDAAREEEMKPDVPFIKSKSVKSTKSNNQSNNQTKKRKSSSNNQSINQSNNQSNDHSESDERSHSESASGVSDLEGSHGSLSEGTQDEEPEMDIM